MRRVLRASAPRCPRRRGVDLERLVLVRSPKSPTWRSARPAGARTSTGSCSAARTPARRGARARPRAAQKMQPGVLVGLLRCTRGATAPTAASASGDRSSPTLASVRVTVLGATGTIGRALVPALARDHEVVAVSRRARDADDDSRVRWVAADATDADAVAAAVAGDRRRRLPRPFPRQRDFEQRDLLAARTVAPPPSGRACGRSSTSAGSATRARPFRAPPQPQARQRARWPSGAVPVTTLRAAMVVGAGQRRVRDDRRARRPAAGHGHPRWVETPTQPVALEDVVAYLAGSAATSARSGGRSTSEDPR